MAALEMSSTTDPGRRAPDAPSTAGGGNVLWLAGEHDLSTSYADSAALATAIAVDDGDLVVDLSRVRFMDGSTIRTLVSGHTFLAERSRSMTLRAPSSSAALVIKVTGIAAFIAVQPARDAP